MYKFPVIKNNNEYAIHIYKDPIWNVGFRVTLYIKKKFLFFTYDSKIEEDIHVFDDENDADYIKMLESNSLFKVMIYDIVETYEQKNLGKNLLKENELFFELWDGNL